MDQAQKNGVTLEELFEMLVFIRDHAVSQEMFNERFDGLEKRMDGLEKRMDGLEKRMDGLEKRMDILEKKMDYLENKMEDGFSSIRSQIMYLEKDVEELKRQLDRLEKRSREDADALSENHSLLANYVLPRQILRRPKQEGFDVFRAFGRAD